MRRVNKPYTDKELEYLIKHYPTTSNKDIAMVLGRNAHGVKKKGLSLGLKKNYSTKFGKGNNKGGWNIVPNGTISFCERLGYYRIKVKGKWRVLSRYLWEQENGKIPDGYIAKFKDDNPRNCKISNIEIMPLNDLLRSNSIVNYPTSLRNSLIRLGNLKKVINNINRKNNE